MSLYKSFSSLGCNKKIETFENFENIQENMHMDYNKKMNIISTNPIVCVKVYSDGCHACNNIKSVYEKFTEEYRRKGCLLVRQPVNSYDNNKEPRLQGYPTFHIYYKGQLHSNVLGADIPLLQNKLNNLILLHNKNNGRETFNENFNETYDEGFKTQEPSMSPRLLLTSGTSETQEPSMSPRLLLPSRTTETQEPSMSPRLLQRSRNSKMVISGGRSRPRSRPRSGYTYITRRKNGMLEIGEQCNKLEQCRSRECARATPCVNAPNVCVTSSTQKMKKNNKRETFDENFETCKPCDPINKQLLCINEPCNIGTDCRSGVCASATADYNAPKVCATSSTRYDGIEYSKDMKKDNTCWIDSMCGGDFGDKICRHNAAGLKKGKCGKCPDGTVDTGNSCVKQLCVKGKCTYVNLSRPADCPKYTTGKYKGRKYKNTGATCFYGKTLHTLPGLFKPMTCNTNNEVKKGARCYKKCAPGYVNAGEVCLKLK